MTSPEQMTLSSKIKNISLDSIARAFIYAGMLLLPLFFLPVRGFPIDTTKTLFLMVFVIGSFLVWLFARLKQGTIVIPRSLLLASWAFFVLTIVTSALFSPAQTLSFYGFTFEIGTALVALISTLLIFLASLFFDSQKTVTRFYQVLLVVFCIVALFQAIRLVLPVDALPPWEIFANPVSNLIGKWNDLGLFAGFITLLSLITLETLALSRFSRGFLYGVLALSILVLSAVSFFLAWISVGALALVLFVYRISFLKPFKAERTAILRSFLSPSFIVVIIATIFLIWGSTIGIFVSNKLNTFQLEVRPAWSATGVVLRETIKDNPLFGSGPNRFNSQWLLHKPDVINNSIFWNTEFNSGVGLFPTFAVTTGVLGTVAFSLFLILFLYTGISYLLFLKPRTTPQYTIFSSFLLGVYIFTISVFYIPTIGVFAFGPLMTGIFIAGLLREGKIKTYTANYFTNPRAGFVTVLLIVLVIIGLVFISYGVAKRTIALFQFQKGRIVVNESGDFTVALQSIEKAASWSKADTFYRALSEIRVRQIRELLLRTGNSDEAVRLEFQSLLGAGINAGQLAVQFDGTNYGNWLALSRVYASVSPFVPGAYENAKTTFTEARARNPRNPLLLLEEGRLEIGNSNVTAGRHLIEEALAMKPDYADAIFALAQLDIAEGDVDKAAVALEQASLIAPNDQGLLFQLGLLKFNSKKYEEAARVLERAIALNAQFANAKYFLGLSYDRLGKRQAAIDQFTDLLRSNPDNGEIQQILRNLKGGKRALSGILEEDSVARRTELPIVE